MSYAMGTASNAADLLQKLHTTLTSKGSAYGLKFSGVGNGIATAWDGGASSVVETFTLTATSATSFSVVGSVSGAIGTATVGSAFVHAKLSISLAAGTTPFAAGDTFTLNTARPWQTQRYTGAMAYVVGPTLSNFPNAIDTSTTSYATATAFPTWAGMRIITAKEVRSFNLACGDDTTNTAASLELQWSDNGTDWTTAQTYTGVTWASTYLRKTFNVTSAPGTHPYWRVKFLASNATTIKFDQLAFFQDAPGSDQIPWAAQAIWKTTGNDDQRSIYLGAAMFWDSSVGYSNIRFSAFTAYNAALTIWAQPGAFPCPGSPVLSLWDNPMPYWIVVNGNRFALAARVSTTYVSAYAGLINAYLPPGQYPLPLFVGATMAWGVGGEPATSSTSWKYNYQGSENHSFWRGHPNINVENMDSCSGRLRRPDGSWAGVSAAGHHWAKGGSVQVWPYCATGSGLATMGPNLDGGYPVMPIVLSSDHGSFSGDAVETYGDFDGVFAVPGIGQVAENTLTIGSHTYLVVQDAWRQTTSSFAALKLD